MAASFRSAAARLTSRPFRTRRGPTPMEAIGDAWHPELHTTDARVVSERAQRLVFGGGAGVGRGVYEVFASPAQWQWQATTDLQLRSRSRPGVVTDGASDSVQQPGETATRTSISRPPTGAASDGSPRRGRATAHLRGALRVDGKHASESRASSSPDTLAVAVVRVDDARPEPRALVSQSPGARAAS